MSLIMVIFDNVDNKSIMCIERLININNLEILEPYSNEILYSWLSRMFYWYGFRNKPRSNIRAFNMLFFGINTRTINNIIIPHNIQDLVNKIQLRDSKSFSTEEILINKMTLIPFYFAFLDEEEQKKVYENIIHNGPINVIKSLLGLKDLNCISSDFKLKFCYKCWIENNNAYFDLEHQVKDNCICYKHHTRLQYIEIDSSNYILLNNIYIDKCKELPYCINQKDEFLQYYSKISSMIHEIFTNGFKDNIVKLKAKIRMRLLSMGYMRNDFDFLEKFDEVWTCYSKYNVLGIDKKEFINVIYSTTNNPNPITYLTMIICLFGTLKSYFEYKIDDKDITIIYQKSTKIISLTQPLKPNGFIYYEDLIHKIYGEQFSIQKKVKKRYYQIRCNLCNHEWTIPQYYIRGNFVRCPCCGK